MIRIHVFWGELADISAEIDPLLMHPSHLKPCINDCFLASHLRLFPPLVIDLAGDDLLIFLFEYVAVVPAAVKPFSKLNQTVFWIL